ncbi:DUF551 domain-containing protein, partial [Escherichia coli]
MTTFTDKELIKEIKERIGSLDVRDNIERRAYEIALASLEAEPVAWMRDDADGREYNARNEFSGGGGGVPLYATPPAPVVPEEKPMPNPLSMYAVDAVAAIAEVRGWNACRAAMLHGAEPVSQTYKLNELSGNYPVTPDGWISCSERMPAQDDWILIYSKHGEYMAGQVQGEYVELSDGTL